MIIYPSSVTLWRVTEEGYLVSESSLPDLEEIRCCLLVSNCPGGAQEVQPCGLILKPADGLLAWLFSLCASLAAGIEWKILAR